jgi:hypothetical protein
MKVRRLHWCALTVCAALSVSACSSDDAQPRTTITGGDSIAYLSVESLARRADVVVVGLVGKVTEKFTDNGGDPVNPEMPALLQALRVERVMKGASDVAVGSEVSLVLHDNDKLPSNEDVRLEPGSRVLLFLRRASGPVNGRHVTALLPVSGSNGIFDVAATGTTTPRSIRIRALAESDARASITSASTPDRVFLLDEIHRYLEQIGVS